MSIFRGEYQYRRLVNDWRRISPYFLGDYYPLTPHSLAEDAWIAWQFDRPDLGEGMIQVFRRKQSIYESARLRFRGLDADAVYLISNLDVPDTKELTGSQLMGPGMSLAIENQPGAAVIVYKRLK